MSNFWQFQNLGESEAELLLYGDIRSEKPWWSEGDDGIYPRQFNSDLKSLGDVSQINVRINSNGGDVFAATSIYTALKSHPANVTVKIDGVAASAATIIAMAGDTVQAPSNALFMIHDPLLVLFGYYNAEDMTKMVSVLGTVKDSILNAYANKTNRDRQDLSDMMASETWMTAEEAKAEGFIDEILFEDSIDATITNDNRFLVVNSVLHDVSLYQTRPQLPKKPANAVPTKPVPPAIPKVENKPKESGESVEIKNIDDLRKQFPDFCNQLEVSAKEDERNRLKAIDEIASTVPQNLVEKAKYEQPMTAEALAFEALRADAAAGRTFTAVREAEMNAAAAVDAAPSPTLEDEKEVQEGVVVDAIAASLNSKRNNGGQR